MTPNATPVVVTDIQMQFSSMVVFMVKWALAAIPALIILFAIGVGLFFSFGIVTTTLNEILGPGKGGPAAPVSHQSTSPF